MVEVVVLAECFWMAVTVCWIHSFCFLDSSLHHHDFLEHNLYLMEWSPQLLLVVEGVEQIMVVPDLAVAAAADAVIAAAVGAAVDVLEPETRKQFLVVMYREIKIWFMFEN